VILATDGDFNLGQTGDEDMRQLILQEQGTGIYLTCLGVGMDNYKDSKLETLARWGHGNFAYIDHPEEAEKVFGKEFVNTLFTVARNARIHLLFNPVKVKSYRLIGYENRLLPMDDDSTAFELMGGDIGAGSCVTAFYELESSGSNGTDSASFSHSNELAELSLQYELATDGAHGQIRQLVRNSPLPFARADDDYRFAASVGLWGMLLRNSHYAGSGTLGEVESIARHALGEDAEGYRRQFLKLIKEQQKAERKKKRK
jgi:Ca-activated chloride channel family protein